jgi:SAM-dependent methyltransferase
MELSRPRIDYARSHGVLVLEPADLADGAFDFINAEQVLEHVPEPLETLRILRRALKPGGLVRIGIPNGLGIGNRLRRGEWSAPASSRVSLNPIAPLEHINCFTTDVLRQTMERAGLMIVSGPGRIPGLKRLRQTVRAVLSGPSAAVVVYARSAGA